MEGVEDTAGINAVYEVKGIAYSVGDAGVVFADGRPVARLGSCCNFIGSAGDAIVTGGSAGILFDALTGTTIHKHRSPLNCSASFTRRGVRHLILGTYTGEALIFAEAGGGLRFEASLPMHDNAIKGIACNGTEIFSVCATGAVAFHAVDSFELLNSITNAHRKISNGAAVLPDGRFASVSRDLSLRLWTRDGNEEFTTPHDHSIKCIAACSKSAILATGSYSGCVALFDTREQRWIKFTRPTAAGISSICPTGKEGQFLASSYDGRIYPIET
jgi:WD40 repeat protein